MNIDDNSISVLIKKLGNDTMITKSEIKKLALYASGENIDYRVLLNAIGDNSAFNLSMLSDSLGISSFSEIENLYNSAAYSGSNYIVILWKKPLTKS